MITTIITTYERPRLLKRAIYSVLSQTYQNFCVAVYDNGSDLETKDIMETLIKEDSRISYCRHQKNIGMMANYEYAFARINTPFFSILSDDDFLLPSFYETTLKGFEQHPDVALSVCGVVAVDDYGNAVAAPLSLWNRDGYYRAGEGLLEMIRDCFKFPIPNGILFRHALTKNISPDFSQEQQLMWDPDYIVAILSRYPCVITKQNGAVYSAHSFAYSSGFYAQMPWDVNKYASYFLTRVRILNRIKKNEFLNHKVRRYAAELFRIQVVNEVCRYIDILLNQGMIRRAHLLAKHSYSYLGYSRQVFVRHVIAFGSVLCLAFVFFQKSLGQIFFKYLSKLRERRFGRAGSVWAVPQHKVSGEEVCLFHQYGERLYQGKSKI